VLTLPVEGESGWGVAVIDPAPMALALDGERSVYAAVEHSASIAQARAAQAEYQKRAQHTRQAVQPATPDLNHESLGCGSRKVRINAGDREPCLWQRAGDHHDKPLGAAVDLHVVMQYVKLRREASRILTRCCCVW